MKIGIIGGGAVGLLMAALLGLDGHHVTVYVKSKKQRERLNKYGITFYPGTRRINVAAKLLQDIEDEDLLMVCVKQYHLSDVFPYINNVTSPLLFLQNGMGHLALLKTLPDQRPVFVGVVEHGAKREDKTIIFQSGKGKLRIAEFNQAATPKRDILSSISSKNFPVVCESDWEIMLVNKLVINAVINPITAIFDVKNGELLTNQELFKMASILTKEVCDVLDIPYQLHWKKVQEICRNTSANMSSMRADLTNKQQTEIESMTGYLLDYAVDKRTAFISFTYHAVKALEVKGSNPYAD